MNTEAVANSTFDKAIRVKAGWVAPRKGYFLSDSVMRDTVKAWSIEKETVKVLRGTIGVLKEEIARNQAASKVNLRQLEEQMRIERTDYNKRLRKTKTRGLIFTTLVGVTVGVIAHNK